MSSLPEIEIWQGTQPSFATQGGPSPVIHILGRVVSDTPLHGLSYSLGGGRRFPVPVGADGFRLLKPGDFNIEIDRRRLQPGRQALKLFAVDCDGRQTTRTIDLNHNREPTGSAPYVPQQTVFDFQSASTLGGGATEGPGFEVVDGRWCASDEGVRILEPGYDRILAMGDIGWTNYDVTAEFTFHGLDDSATSRVWPSMQPELSLRVYWQGHYDWGDIRPARGWFPMAADGGWQFTGDEARLQLRHHPASSPDTCPSPFELQPNQRYRLRVQVQTIEGQFNRYAVKGWPIGEPEPDDWQIQASGNPNELRHGSVLFNAHHVDVTLHHVAIVPIAT